MSAAAGPHAVLTGPLFDVRQAELHFGSTHALRSVSLRIARGERVAVIGANGSGKSTLLRLLNGLVQPQSGAVRVQSGLRQAFVFQRPWMLHASALANVALGLWLSGVGWRSAREQAQAALARVGLAAQAAQSGKTLSGGQQQRLALGRAWALAPDVLLLDEPTANLDPAGKKEVEALMASFAGNGCTLVFSSHNLGQVKRLASRVIYLEHGELVADLPVQAFFNGPLPPRAEMFVKGELE